MSHLFAPHPDVKRLVRVVRLEHEPTAALLDALDDAETADDVLASLCTFYDARAVALELRRRDAIVPPAKWSALRRRLALLGGADLLSEQSPALIRRELDRIEQGVELLASLGDTESVLAADTRAQIACVLDDAQLRVRDPARAARAWADSVLDPEAASLESIAEAALEVCTGPDPLCLDIEVGLGCPHVYGAGFELIRVEDECSAVEEAFVVVGDDLQGLAEGCAEVRERMDPVLDGPAPPRFADEIERLGELARSLHGRGDAGLLVVRILNPGP